MEYQELYERIKNLGFTSEGKSSNFAFDNFCYQFSRNDLQIRFVKDRGTLGFDIKEKSSAQWFDLPLVLEAIGITSPLSVEDQLAALSVKLEVISDYFKNEGVDKLIQLGTERFEKRRALRK